MVLAALWVEYFPVLADFMEQRPKLNRVKLCPLLSKWQISCTHRIPTGTQLGAHWLLHRGNNMMQL